MSKEKPESSTAPTLVEPEPIKASTDADLEEYLEKQAKGYEVRLPDSGLVFRVGRPNMTDLLNEGVIPDELVPAALSMEDVEFKPKSKEDLLNMKSVIDKTITAAVVYPKLVEEKTAGKGQFPITMLTERDKIALYLFVGRGPAELQPFRQEPQGDVPGQSTEEVPGDKTEPVDGDQGSVDRV